MPFQSTSRDFQSSTVQNPSSSSLVSGKSSAAPPKLSTLEADVELKDIKPEDGTDAPEEDIMELAKLGDIGEIQKLFKSGRFDARYQDEEGTTPLHVGFLSRRPAGHFYEWAKGVVRELTNCLHLSSSSGLP
jgi:palmitoyltransferase